MRKILDVLGLVPVWAYVAAVLALGGLLMASELGRYRALGQVGQARADLAEVRRDHAMQLAVAVQRARTAEAVLAADLMRETNELQSLLSDRDRRVSDLADRLHQHARPLRLCPTSTGGAATAAGSGHGVGGAGLRGVDGPDLVVLDEQARADLAQFATAARDVGETLKSCRVLLRQSWRSTY